MEKVNGGNVARTEKKNDGHRGRRDTRGSVEKIVAFKNLTSIFSAEDVGKSAGEIGKKFADKKANNGTI